MNKRRCKCIKDFKDYMPPDQMEYNNIEIVKGGIYNVFEKGKEYNFFGPIKATSGNKLIVVDMHLENVSVDHGKYLTDRFYWEIPKGKGYKKRYNKFIKKYGVGMSSEEKEEILKDFKTDQELSVNLFKDFFEII